MEGQASNPLAQLGEELAHVTLKHVEEVNDRSAPLIEPDVHVKPYDKTPLLDEIEKGVELQHVDINDRSTPKIEPGVSIGSNHRDELLSEIKVAAGHHAVVSAIKHHDVPPLHHVETVDKSQPSIQPDVVVKQWDKQGLLSEISSPHKLRHVDESEVHDGSKPIIGQGLSNLGHNPREDVLQELVAEPHPLRHVPEQEVHDCSAPVTDKTSALRITSSLKTH